MIAPELFLTLLHSCRTRRVFCDNMVNVKFKQAEEQRRMIFAWFETLIIIKSSGPEHPINKTETNKLEMRDCQQCVVIIIIIIITTSGVYFCERKGETNLANELATLSKMEPIYRYHHIKVKYKHAKQIHKHTHTHRIVIKIKCPGGSEPIDTSSAINRQCNTSLWAWMPNSS